MQVEWWETRSLQLRTDCIIMNGDKQQNPEDANRTCLDTPPATGESAADLPYCYTMDDGCAQPPEYLFTACCLLG